MPFDVKSAHCGAESTHSDAKSCHSDADSTHSDAKSAHCGAESGHSDVDPLSPKLSKVNSYSCLGKFYKHPDYNGLKRISDVAYDAPLQVKNRNNPLVCFLWISYFDCLYFLTRGHRQHQHSESADILR